MPILESLDEDPEMEPGQADTTPGNADSDKDDENKPASPLGRRATAEPGRKPIVRTHDMLDQHDSKSRPAN